MRLLTTVSAGVLIGLVAWVALRPASSPTSPSVARVPARTEEAAVVPRSEHPAPGTGETLPAPLATIPDAEARKAAETLMAEAATARSRGDLRTTVDLLQAAVERAPAVETHAALGGLYLEMGVTSAADVHLRAAAMGDAGNADRWIALANALARKPDPGAAAEALERARATEPSLRVGRDARGWLARGGDASS